MGFFNRKPPPKQVNATQLDCQFAVVDIETTGLSELHNRIIEIAILIMNARGEVLYEWHTLVNPEDSDAGPTAIHGIQGGWLKAAPTFRQIAGDIGELFLNRVPVAHNGRFDFGFIEAEFRRAGFAVRSDLVYFDTMTTAELIGLPRKLTTLASELGVAYFAHGAIEDARTTAKVLAKMLQSISPATFTNELFVSPGVFPPIPPSRKEVHRAAAATLTQPSNFLAEVVGHLPSHPRMTGQVSEAAVAYLTVLERCMEDGYLSTEEKAQLLQTAQHWGLTLENVYSIHEEFLDSLLVGALTTRGTLDKAHRADIMSVASWLGVAEDQIDVLLRRARVRARAEIDENRAEVKGRTIAFTGKGMFSNSIREGLCAKYGVVFKSSVTKDCELLVLGTPDVDNTNVAKARQLNLRIVNEAFFWSYLGEKG